jgi:acetoin utilization protein AcuB
MFVGRRMTKTVVTVSPGDTLRHAGGLLKERRIHHLPVVEGEDLVGMVSDTDIRNLAFEETSVDAEGAIVVKNRTIAEIMTRDVVTVSPGDTVEDALLILHRKRFGALPVVEGRKLVGLITKADVLAALLETLDIEGIGVRIEVILPRDTDAVQRLIRRLGEMDVEIKSLILSPFHEKFAAFIRLATIDVAAVRSGLREAGFLVPDVLDCPYCGQSHSFPCASG